MKLGRSLLPREFVPLDRAFADIGAPGVFVREIEHALLEERIDLAVHSYKDLPSAGPKELVVAAVPERLDPADRLIAHPKASKEGGTIPLVSGARVGTASARRQALLRSLRPDLEILPLRGNVPTRLAKVPSGELDAVILASAAHAHAMIGIAVPTQHATITWNGRQYAPVELTAEGWTIGLMPPERQSPWDWRVLPADT